MKSATVQLDWQLYTNCPYCNHNFDLVEAGSDCDYNYDIFLLIFNNKWESVNGTEILCPSCEEEFQIKEVIY